MIRIAGKIKSGLQLLVSKIKVYWRLFFQRMPLLRNATGIALLLFALFYWVRFDAPLNFQFSETGSHFQFIQESGLEDLYRGTANLELFDTAPIFIPTRWNYASTVFPERRISSDAEFVSFEPVIEIKKSIQLNRSEVNSETLNYSILYENTFFDPRLLELLAPSLKRTDNGKRFSNNPTLRVEIIESYDVAKFSGEAIVEFDYELDKDALLSNLDPMIIFLRNESALLAQPKVYQSSLSEIFDEQILEWLNQPRHIALLPKGFLKLTFYPN